VTQGWVTQELLKNPSLRVLIGSAKKEHAIGFSGAIRRNFEQNQRFIDRFGRLTVPGKGKAEAWDTTGHTHGDKEHSVTAASIGTDMTSQHYDLIVLDDPINREFAQTEKQRQKVVEFYMDCQDLLMPNGRIVIIGTRWHFADIYSKLITQNKKTKSFQYIIDEAMMINHKYTRRDFELMLEDPETEFLFPEMFDRKVAKKKFVEKISQPNGYYEFSCQQMNFPVSDRNKPFRFEDIKFCRMGDVPSSVTLYQNTDPAGSERLTSTQDDTAIATTGIDVNLDIYNVDMWADRTTAAGLFMKMDEQARKYPNTRKIGIERNFNHTNTLWIKDKYPHIAMKLVDYKMPNTPDAKEANIMVLQPYVANGKFYIVQHEDGEEYSIGDKVVRLHPGQYKLVMQMIDFGQNKEEHDDALDAQSATFEFLKKPKLGNRNNAGYTYTPQSSRTGY
jgi:hypothetical protein